MTTVNRVPKFPARTSDWWRTAAIYQVYPRSFADANGDGIGDLAGIRSRLGYLRDLGVDAVWFSPWYPSPMADAGYDVADYRDIDPAFGTLDEARQLIGEAHDFGLRIIVDIVPNHCSDQHPWFREAVAAGAGSAARELFWFRDGRGPDGSLPPNNWQSVFGGSAWTRVPDGQWYLHLFAPEQPDFNWDNPAVRKEFEDILRFWFDLGVDGMRIDSAALIVKDPELADFDPAAPPVPHPHTDRDGIHEIYRGWRRIADSYPDPRALIGEIWLADSARFTLYLRPDEIHTAFNFDFLACPWDEAALRANIDRTLSDHALVGAPATWVLSNHDVTRHVTRYGRQDTTFDHDAQHRRRLHGSPCDLELGTRRARAAALLTMALPGSVYVYQGEELGLAEVEDIADNQRQDPMFARSGGLNPGRDGCRVPLAWSGTTQPYGFGPVGAAERPWLPQPASWATQTVEAQTGDASSMLELYRHALALRAKSGLMGSDTSMQWREAPAGVLSFTRGDRFACVVNLSAEPVALPEHDSVVMLSEPLSDGLLGGNATAWLWMGQSAGAAI